MITPTYNRRQRLRRVLEALAVQRTNAPFEVIVISDGSDDGTDEDLAVCDLPLHLRWASQANQGPAVARNLGVEMAVAPLVLFLDDDVIPDRDLIAKHLATHRRTGAHAVVIGPMLDPPDHEFSPWVRWEQRKLAKQYHSLLSGDYEPTFRQFYTGNASMARDDVVAAGGFDPSYRRAEDVELGIRLWDCGARFVYDHGARGHHYAVRSYEAWRDVARSYGQLDVGFGRHPSREWQWEFLSSIFRSRHIATRTMLLATLRFPALGDLLASCARRPIELLDRTSAGGAAQALLSMIYACDYWRAAAQALGGRVALAELVERYRDEGSGGPVIPACDHAHGSATVIAAATKAASCVDEPADVLPGPVGDTATEPSVPDGTFPTTTAAKGEP